MTGGRTRLVGLIGWPLQHSLSPQMHNAAFCALGLNWRYVPLAVPPGAIGEAIAGLVALGFRGCNVTIPHKEAACAHVSHLTPDVRAIGAVNTLVIHRREYGGGRVEGHNTDKAGFLGVLEREGMWPLTSLHAVVVGAGGAARAVVAGLLERGAQVTVLNRDPKRADVLARQLGMDMRLRSGPLVKETLVECGCAADLLVNATPVGSWPDQEASIWPPEVRYPAHLAVFDLVYSPQETRLLRSARESGACTFGGIELLVAQGAQAFELWTGLPAPLEVMRIACRRGGAR